MKILYYFILYTRRP